MNAQSLGEMTPSRGGPGVLGDSGGHTCQWPHLGSSLRGGKPPCLCLPRPPVFKKQLQGDARLPTSLGRFPLCEGPRPEPPHGHPGGPALLQEAGERRTQRREGGRERAARGRRAGAGDRSEATPSTGGPPSAPAPRPSHVSSPLEFNFGHARGLSSYSQKKNSRRAGWAEDRARVVHPPGARLKMTGDLGKSLCSSPDLRFSECFPGVWLKSF